MMSSTQQVEMGYGQPSYDETIDPSLAESTGEAYPTDRVLDGSRDHGYSQEWAEPCRLPGGRTGTRIYLFTEADVEAAGEHADMLPWDDEHVARIRLDG